MAGPLGRATLALQMQGADITTVEGLAQADGTLHPVQAAFKECHGLQCGFCAPGMVMSTVDLLAHHPQASEAEIRHLLEGNLCRCTGYQNIVRAVQTAQKPGRLEGLKPPPGDKTMGAENDLPSCRISANRSSARRTMRFLTSVGNYTDDVDQANQKYAYFVRSRRTHMRARQGAWTRPRPPRCQRGRHLQRQGHWKENGRPALRLVDQQPDGSPEMMSPCTPSRDRQGALRG